MRVPSKLYLQDGARCRLAQVQDWGEGEVFDLSTRFVGVGRDAYCHWLPSLLGGAPRTPAPRAGRLRAWRRHGLPRPVLHRGARAPDVFAVDLHGDRTVGGDVHWRGAATGESRASFEGLNPDRPGRAADAHLPADPLDDALAESARWTRSLRCSSSSDDVSASHGGTVGELDETAIFYMQTRGLDRPAAVRVIVEGFFEPLISELEDEPLEELVRAKVADKLAAARDDIEAYATSR